MKPAARTLAPELLRKMDAWWRAANYLSVGQLYLYDNPLLREPLKLAQQGIVVEVKLSDRQIVRGAPIGVHLAQEFGSERSGS